MKKLFLIFSLLLPVTSVYPVETGLLLDCILADGWKKSSPVRQFSESSLFQHINGAAELFNEFGFENLQVIRYRKGGEELTLELYRMKNSTAALGIYLYKCGKETPVNGLELRHTINAFQAMAVRGFYYILISNASGSPENQPAMEILLSRISEQIPDDYKDSLLNLLPEPGLIRGTERIFRGPYGLEPVYTFGQDDVLQLKGEVFGVTASYTNGEDQYRTLVIDYESPEQCLDAFQNLRKNLDSTCTILSTSDTRLIFSDYKHEFASVVIESAQLHIQVDLDEMPSSY